MSDIVERLRGYANDDHERGCQGRYYDCSCGYDDKRNPLLTDAADEIARLRAENERLRAALGKGCHIMAHAHDRIHALPRSSDTKLAHEIEVWRADARATLTTPPAPSPWRPIETAPRDELILVGPTKRMGICAAMHHSRDGWVTETCSDWVPIHTPTHWMPLPPAPKDDE